MIDRFFVSLPIFRQQGAPDNIQNLSIPGKIIQIPISLGRTISVRTLESV
jgi:hypothetical protein